MSSDDEKKMSSSFKALPALGAFLAYPFRFGALATWYVLPSEGLSNYSGSCSRQLIESMWDETARTVAAPVGVRHTAKNCTAYLSSSGVPLDSETLAAIRRLVMHLSAS